MDNAQKAIMIGVGLFITIIVIAAVMLITGIGQDMLNTGTNQLSGISEELSTSTFATYQDKLYNTGSLAQAASKNIINMGGEAYINNGSAEYKINSLILRTLREGSLGDSPSNNRFFYRGDKYKCNVSGKRVDFIRQF